MGGPSGGGGVNTGGPKNIEQLNENILRGKTQGPADGRVLVPFQGGDINDPDVFFNQEGTVELNPIAQREANRSQVFQAAPPNPIEDQGNLINTGGEAGSAEEIIDQIAQERAEEKREFFKQQRVEKNQSTLISPQQNRASDVEVPDLGVEDFTDRFFRALNPSEVEFTGESGRGVAGGDNLTGLERRTQRAKQPNRRQASGLNLSSGLRTGRDLPSPGSVGTQQGLGSATRAGSQRTILGG